MQALFVDPRCIYLDSREGMDGGQGVAGRGSTDPGIRSSLGCTAKGWETFSNGRRWSSGKDALIPKISPKAVGAHSRSSLLCKAPCTKAVCPDWMRFTPNK